MVLQVYLDPCTVNSRKVLAGLEHMGIKYELNHVNYFTGEHKKPEYLAINPNGTVPGAVDGDVKIFESNAILAYAANDDDKAYPKDPKTRALVNSWLLWEASNWFSSCYVYLVEYVVKPLLKDTPDDKKIEAHAPSWHALAKQLDTQLGKTKYLVGNEPTIADFAVAAPMHLHAAERLPLDQHPNLKRWLTQDIESLPAWKKTQGAVDKALLPGVVRSTFNYTKDVAPKPTELFFYDTPDAKGIHEPGDDAHEMQIHDGWERNSGTPFSVDKEGFSVHDLKTSYNQWEDTDGVKNNFYPEVVDFLKKTLGAKRVLVFDHTIRTKANVAKALTDEKNTSQRSPVMLVHCDYTAESGPIRVKQLLEGEADELLQRRVAFINVWKPVKNVVEERPLAMCEVPSAPNKDFFKLHLRYRERNGENYVMRHSDGHKWWYFPKMTPEQVILLKTYDSEEDGRARFMGHTAFEDPTSPPDAPVRESVEIRTICFF